MLQPIPLEDFVALATMLDFPIRGLQLKVIKFSDDQVSDLWLILLQYAINIEIHQRSSLWVRLG